MNAVQCSKLVTLVFITIYTFHYIIQLIESSTRIQTQLERCFRLLWSLRTIGPSTIN